MKHRPGCPCSTCAPKRRGCDVEGCDNAATHVPQLTLGDANGKRLNATKATIGLLLCAEHRSKPFVREFVAAVPQLKIYTVLAIDFVSLDHHVARQLDRVRGAA